MANCSGWTPSVASSLSWKDRLSKFTEPTLDQAPSTVSDLACNIVGPYSQIRAPASSNCWYTACPARRTNGSSVCTPGTTGTGQPRASPALIWCSTAPGSCRRRNSYNPAPRGTNRANSAAASIT